MSGVREVKTMSDYKVLSKVAIPGTIVEKVENEAVGVRYKIKIKSNDKLEYLWFEEDELGEILQSTDSEEPEEP